jgi:hypothetical protein
VRSGDWLPAGDASAGPAGVAGGNPPRRPDQALQVQSRAGTGPAPQTNIIIARTVIIEGAMGGLFVYEGTPGPGNPPAFAITTASADPYGNPVTGPAVTSSGLPFLIYSGTPALGNLIISLAPAAGVDDVGNAYPEGLNVTAGLLSGVAIKGTTLTLQPGPFLLYGNSSTVQVLLTGSGNWTAPAGVTSVFAECIGGGGGGNVAFGTGGGGGEYAAEPALAVTPGNNYAYSQGLTVGSATNGNNTTFAGDTVTVTAHGGQSVLGAGGTGSTNTTHFNGGNGGLSTGPGFTNGGGGGASAGPASAGNNGAPATVSAAGAGGAAVSGGGNGGNGGASGNGSNGGTPGGGGGGAGGSLNAGGSGVTGLIRLTYAASGSSQLLITASSFIGNDPATGAGFGQGLNVGYGGGPHFGVDINGGLDLSGDAAGVNLTKISSTFNPNGMPLLTPPAGGSAAGLAGYWSTSAAADFASFTITGTSAAQASKAWSIPANDAQAGTTYRMTIAGIGTQGTTAQQLTFQILLGSTSFAAATLLSTFAAISAGFIWKAILEVTVHATGAGGTADYRVDVYASAANNAPPASAWVSTGAFNTTIANTYELQMFWSSATGAPTAGSRHSYLERLGP